jgi:hypothetical protein
MRAARIAGVVFIVVAINFIVALVLGGMLPRAHTATASVIVSAPQAVVWQRIEDVASQPTWRTGLNAVQMLPSRNGHPCWLEIQKYGKMPLCEELAAPPATRVVQIADPNLSFGGIWTFELSPVDAQSTHVSITENGTTGPWLWRFAGHYIFQEDTMIKQYEADLQKSVGKP